jgi:sirohydrochlorin cobaltochelatase
MRAGVSTLFGSYTINIPLYCLFFLHMLRCDALKLTRCIVFGRKNMQCFKRFYAHYKPMFAGLLSAALLFASASSMAQESMAQKSMPPTKSAIVLAAFGTSYGSALDALLAIEQCIKRAYPNTPVRFAFTSNQIRAKWHARMSDANYRAQYPKVPTSLYEVKNILGTLADLQDQGYKNIVVQPTLLTPGEEFNNLKATIDGLLAIKTEQAKSKPFERIALGRPLMGSEGRDFNYRGDLLKLAGALSGDVARAAQSDTALVYMGHGNSYRSSGLYHELAEQLNALYPKVRSYVGLVEGRPNIDSLIALLKRNHITAVTLKPLMVVAGDHAINDMAGDAASSWKSQLIQAGIRITPVLEGLGSQPSIQAIYLNHLADAAKNSGIPL